MLSIVIVLQFEATWVDALRWKPYFAPISYANLARSNLSDVALYPSLLWLSPVLTEARTDPLVKDVPSSYASSLLTAWLTWCDKLLVVTR